MLVFHIIIRAASGIFNHRITNNFDIPRPAFSPPPANFAQRAKEPVSQNSAHCGGRYK